MTTLQDNADLIQDWLASYGDARVPFLSKQLNLSEAQVRKALKHLAAYGHVKRFGFAPPYIWRGA